MKRRALSHIENLHETQVGGVKTCTKCALEKSLTLFTKDKKNSADGLCTRCRDCRRRTGRENSNTMNGHLMELLRRSRQKAKLRGQFDGNQGHRMDHSIDISWIRAQLARQNGRCAYSGFPMDSLCYSMYQVSLERLNNMQGYTPENVVMVCNVFNIGHNRRMSREKFLFLMTGATDPMSTKEMNSELTKIVPFCKRLVSDAQNRSRQKGFEFSMTTEAVVKMYFDQGGRCAYSDLRLSFEPRAENWCASLERVNPERGYTPDNCALICLELNTHVQINRKAIEEWRILATNLGMV